MMESSVQFISLGRAPLKRSVVFVCVQIVLCSFMPAQGLAVPATSPSFDRASCVVMVKGVNGYREQNVQIDTVNATLTSTLFVDPVIASTLHLDADTWPQVVSFEITPAGENATKVQVLVRPHEGLPPSPARVLLNALTQKLVKIYASDQSRADVAAQIASDQSRYAVIQKQVSELRAKLTELPNPYQYATAAATDASAARIRQDLEEKTARLDALADAVRESDLARKPLLEAAETTAKAKSDFASLLRQQSKAGDAAAAIEIARAYADADEARQRLLELSLSPLNDPQSPLFSTALQLKMDVAQLEVSARSLSGASSQPSAAARTAAYQQVSEQLESATAEMEALRQKLNREQMNEASAGGGTRVVIAGSDAPAP
jgi:hypothetical protein